MRKNLIILFSFFLLLSFIALPTTALASGSFSEEEKAKSLSKSNDSQNINRTYGLSSPTVLALNPYAFEPWTYTYNVSASGNNRWCDGSDCILTASVNLPSGASVVSIELDSNDTGGSSITAWFGECPIQLGGCNVMGSVTTATSSGYTLISSSVTPAATIDNYNNSYIVEVNLPATSSYQLAGVRLFYYLQISPAPGFATYPDVGTGHWAHQYVEALAASGITQGFPDGTFRPDAAVTRAQMATFLSRALGLHWPN
jgi:hypothetical protein